MQKKSLFILFTFFLLRASAHESLLLPKPQKVVLSSKSFVADKIKISAAVMLPEWKEFMESRGIRVDSNARQELIVGIVPSIPEATANPDEAYRLSVTTGRITVEAQSEKGVYWAMQTLGQLNDGYQAKNAFRTCRIVDWPMFRVRGFMHDVGRSFIPVEELRQEIALLSHFKINVFHWHLTENQAWRLESRLFPMLNDSSNMVRFPGKYYTLEEAKELVAFAQKHNVTVIPEIDMPGHSAAFKKTFRHDMQSPEGMTILKLLMDEVCQTFDVPYIHIGTDEVPFVNPGFVPEMVSYLRAKGKKVVSWTPGWHYREGEIDMVQMWTGRGKPMPGVPSIDSRYHYLNHFDNFGDLIALYNSRIGNVGHGDGNMAGVILALWNDRLIPDYKEIIRQNQFYPNMLAMAERAWRGGGTEYFDGRGVLLPTDESSPEFTAFADFERRLLWYKDHILNDCPVSYVRQTNVKWQISDPFPNRGDLRKVFPPETGAWKEIFNYEGKEYASGQAAGAGIYLRHVWGTLIPAFYRNPRENHTAYAHTWVYSPKEQKVGAWIEFQNYGRSEKDLPPPQGKWDYRESRIWLNGEEIQPPVWSSAHTEMSNEIPLGNENCVARAPVPVNLHRGWNEVLLKLPVGNFRTKELRLVKWMFTTVFVTPDGRNAVDGLVYSPQRKR